jgi:hypothetical protein
MLGIGARCDIVILISLVGLIIMATTLTTLGFPQLRHMEVDLPDHNPALDPYPKPSLLMIGYAVIYLLATLGLTVLVFQKRDL